LERENSAMRKMFECVRNGYARIVGIRGDKENLTTRERIESETNTWGLVERALVTILQRIKSRKNEIIDEMQTDKDAAGLASRIEFHGAHDNKMNRGRRRKGSGTTPSSRKLSTTGADYRSKVPNQKRKSA